MTDEDPAAWWNDEYAGVDAPPWETGDPQPALVDRVESGEVGGRVLDVGCGLGTAALFLADRGHDVVGVDISEVAIDRARERAAGRSLDGSVRFEVVDALALPAADLGRFETAVDCGLLHAFPPEDRDEYAASLASVLVPGGTAVFVEFGAGAPEDWGPIPLSEGDVRDALGDRFRVDAVDPSEFVTRHRAVPGIDVLATVADR